MWYNDTSSAVPSVVRSASSSIPLHGGCGADTLCGCEGSSISAGFHPQFCVKNIGIFGEPPARRGWFLIFFEKASPFLARALLRK